MSKLPPTKVELLGNHGPGVFPDRVLVNGTPVAVCEEGVTIVLSDKDATRVQLDLLVSELSIRNDTPPEPEPVVTFKRATSAAGRSISWAITDETSEPPKRDARDVAELLRPYYSLEKPDLAGATKVLEDWAAELAPDQS